MACGTSHWGPAPPDQQSPKRSHPNQANGILRQDITKHEIYQYFHATTFSPVKSTFISAINNGHFTSWPGLSASLISKNLPQSTFTVKGHLDQEQKNIRSTRSHQDLRDDIHPNKNITPTTSSQQLSTPTLRPPDHTQTRQADPL